MAYATEADAGFRITGFTHGTTGILGRIRAVVNKIIAREVIQADGNNYPVARPVDVIDARCVLGFLDEGGGIAEGTAAANLVIAQTAADGGAGSVTIGTMLPGSIDITMGRRMGGFLAEQTFELVGSLTFTPSI